MEGSRRNISMKPVVGTSRSVARPRPVNNADRMSAVREVKIGERLSADVDLSQVYEADMETVVHALEVIANLSPRMPKLAFRVVRSDDNQFYVIVATGVNVTIDGPAAYRALNPDNDRFLKVFHWEFSPGVITVWSSMHTVVSAAAPAPIAPSGPRFQEEDRREGSRRKRGRIVIEGDHDAAFD